MFLPEGFVARLTFLNGFLTPAEVELPTIGGVHFTKPHEYSAEPLDACHRGVSETMRDLDLVVSVADVGGVDPGGLGVDGGDASGLVREMTRVMRLDNVRFVDDTHVVIEGVLGEYSVHLGSAVVHRRPGGAVCIIPAGTARGGAACSCPSPTTIRRPPRSSRRCCSSRGDGQIKDPTILEQLR